MEFKTQAELLRHLGKNENDRSLVQRMISRKEILRGDGVYILNDRDKKIEELEAEIKKLRSEIATTKASSGDLEELKVNCEYWESKAREYAQYCSDIIEVCYKKVKSVSKGFMETYDEFKEGIQMQVKGGGE